jgi:Domain of unknown function (DUF4351)
VDHDQFFKRLMHLFLREFFELFFADWVDRFDFKRVEWLEQEVFPDPPRGAKRVVDVLAKLPTVPAEPPRANEPRDSLVLIHVEIESADHVTAFAERMYAYYRDVTAKYELDVLPVGIFLSVGLDGRGTDAFERWVWERRVLRFEYDYVGLPGLPAEQYLRGNNMLGVAWSCVMHMARDLRPEAAADAMAIIEASSLTPAQKMALMDFILSYAPRDEIQQRDLLELLKDPKRESVMQHRKTWREEGVEEGWQKRGVDLVGRMLEARFPSVSGAIRERLANLPQERIDQLAVQLLTAKSLKELGLED